MTVVLSMAGVERSFGDRRVLRGLDLRLASGEIRGFLGANGAGKTTGMRILMGLLAPSSGTVHRNGRALTSRDRRDFGYLPEERGLYPRMPIGDQLQYLAQLHGLDRSAARRSAASLLESVGLAERGADWLETLSLGNQQRVQLAAALVADPSVLILDEPFSGLDPIGIQTMTESLRRSASEGRAVLLSSHQLPLVEEACSHVTVLHAGRAVLDESMTALGAAHRQVRIKAEAARGDWALGLPDVTGVTEVRGHDGCSVLLDITPQARTADLLDAVRQRVRLQHFAVERKPLTDIYRAAVS